MRPRIGPWHAWLPRGGHRHNDRSHRHYPGQLQHHRRDHEFGDDQHHRAFCRPGALHRSQRTSDSTWIRTTAFPVMEIPSLTDIMTKQRPDGTSIALYVDPNGLEYSVHRFNDCTTCHSSKPHDVQTPLTKLSLAEKCGSCHQFEYDQYIESVHGAPQTSGNSDPATCTDCHSANSNPHNVVRVLDPSASTYPKNIAQTCAKCHDDPKLMGKYGIVEKVYDSYMRSFHGKNDEPFRGKRRFAAVEHRDVRELPRCAQHQPGLGPQRAGRGHGEPGARPASSVIPVRASSSPRDSWATKRRTPVTFPRCSGARGSSSCLPAWSLRAESSSSSPRSGGGAWIGSSVVRKPPEKEE